MFQKLDSNKASKYEIELAEDQESFVETGHLDDGEMVARLALQPGFHSVWIGLLLVHGGIQGKPVGTITATAIFSAAKSAGYSEIKLGVIDTNVKGIAFWEKMGFMQIGVSSAAIGGKQCKVFVFSRVI